MHLELQLFRLRWSATIMHGSGMFNCMRVAGSSEWSNAEPTGHITAEVPASLDTRKHENHWNNYTHYDTSFCCGRTETVSVSNCWWLRFQLGSSVSMHACMCAAMCVHQSSEKDGSQHPGGFVFFFKSYNGVDHHPVPKHTCEGSSREQGLCFILTPRKGKEPLCN